MNKRHWVATVFAGGILAYALYLGNTWLKITTYEAQCPGLPEDFCGFKVAIVSDLHGSLFGKDQADLLDAVHSFEPDMVAIPGDLLDEREGTLAPALSLLKGLRSLPVYYVCGNHEVGSGNLPAIERQLEAAGVRVLRNEGVKVVRGDSEIAVLGLDDPLSFAEGPGRQRELSQTALSQIVGNFEESTFKILLSHRPELMDVYAFCNVNLVLCGHAHGGLVQIPGIGGLYSPGQGLFPRFTSGVHSQDNTRMVVSRGLGNSGPFQLRVFNRPEIVLVTLRRSMRQEGSR